MRNLGDIKRTKMLVHHGQENRSYDAPDKDIENYAQFQNQRLFQSNDRCKRHDAIFQGKNADDLR